MFFPIVELNGFYQIPLSEVELCLAGKSCSLPQPYLLPLGQRLKTLDLEPVDRIVFDDSICTSASALAVVSRKFAAALTSFACWELDGTWPKLLFATLPGEVCIDPSSTTMSSTTIDGTTSTVETSSTLLSTTSTTAMSTTTHATLTLPQTSTTASSTTLASTSTAPTTSLTTTSTTLRPRQLGLRQLLARPQVRF